jgi:hypothetical protein
MTERSSWYEIVVSECHLVERRRDDGAAPETGLRATDHPGTDRRRVDAQKLAMFGELCLDGESLAPWAAVVIVRAGVVLRTRSYLSTRSLLEEIGIVAQPSPGETNPLGHAG